MNVVAIGLWAGHSFANAFTSGDGPQGRDYRGYSRINPLDAVGSVQRRRRWSGRSGMLIIARGTFRVRFAARLAAHLAFIAAASCARRSGERLSFFFSFLTAAGFFGSARLEDLAAARAARAADFLAAFSFFAVSAACSLCFSLASFFGPSWRRFWSRRIFFFKFFVFIICVSACGRRG